jgi:hypothetical protein
LPRRRSWTIRFAKLTSRQANCHAARVGRKALEDQQGPKDRAGAQGATGAQGPSGPTGPAGAPGAKGDKGDLAAHLFERYFCTPGFGVCLNTTPAEITTSDPAAASYFLRLSLPAGSYMVTAEVGVVAHSPNPDVNPSDWRVQCVARMVAPPSYGGYASATVGDLTGGVNETTVTATFGTPAAAAGDIGIRCWRTAGSGATGVGPNPQVVYAVLDAVEVGAFATSEQS